jgi:2-haloalkanoic acid dehalogenase type II
VNRLAVISFDVYGTLVQFHEAVEATLDAILAETGIAVPMQSLRAEWRATQGPLQQAPVWSPYKRIVAEGLRQVFAARGLPWRADFGERLVEAIATAGPFAEVPDVLAILKRHARLLFISNTDEDMIAGNMVRMPVKPHLAITAEFSRHYKPHPAMFRFAYEQMGVDMADVVHVAAGFHHDIEAAHGLGLRRIWINRRGEAGDPAFGPYGELPDLSRLPEMLGL